MKKVMIGIMMVLCFSLVGCNKNEDYKETINSITGLCDKGGSMTYTFSVGTFSDELSVSCTKLVVPKKAE